MAFRGKLIASGADAKTTKGNGDKYETAIMYMQPWKSAGINVCANAEIAGCIEGCLKRLRGLHLTVMASWPSLSLMSPSLSSIVASKA